MQVKITDKTSVFYGRIGKVWNQGNGKMYQIGIGKTGVYFHEKQFKIIKK